MRHKITRIMALILFLIMMTTTIPLGYAIEWSPDMRLTWNNATDWNPSIAQASDGKIWVVWHSYRTGNADLFYKVYDQSKVHPWSSEMMLTTDSNVDMSPSIMQAKDGKIWVVWSTNRNGNYDIHYKVYDGVSWSPEPPGNLTADPKDDEFPSIMQTANGTIWLSWSANRTGNYEIYYKTSSDNGTTWSLDTSVPVADSTADDQNPSITQTADGKIWVVWVRNNDIFYKTYGSTGWIDSEYHITQDLSAKLDSNPSITQTSNGDIWVVWDSGEEEEQVDIYYKIRQGFLWSANPIKLTTNQADDIMPSIMQATDGNIWIAWVAWRTDNLDIYYITTEIPQPHDVAIFSVIPTEATVPNEQTVSIEIVAQNHGNSSETFNVTAYANSALIYGPETIGLSPGQLYPITFLWNTSSTPPSTYTIWAEVSAVEGETYTVDNTFPAILGDVNGDRTVNAYDLSDFGEAYGSEPGDSSWNPDCNFDGDNNVDAFDLFDLSKNYGRSS